MIGRKRVVIAGLGDVGVLTAIRLARRYYVVGISAEPARRSAAHSRRICFRRFTTTYSCSSRLFT